MPVFFAALTLRGLPIVVVGGGSVAARKAATLRRAVASGATTRTRAPGFGSSPAIGGCAGSDRLTGPDV